MKSTAIAILLIAFALPAAAYPVIGLFEDSDPQNAVCHVDIEPFTTVSVWVCAQLSVDLNAVITAAEFSIHNLLESGAGGIITPFWNTDLVIGDPGYGIALAYSPGLPALFAVLGELQFFAVDEYWVDDDYEMEIIASNSSGYLALVDGDFETWDAEGGHFYFNPTGPWDVCPYIAQPPTATGGISWGEMKSLY